jgi:hypothetical protein
MDEFAQLALDPSGGGGSAALRTGLVIAGMPREEDLLGMIGARKGPTAQSRRTAMGDGPEGAALIR